MDTNQVADAEKDPLELACDAAAEQQGAPWLAGVLEGAIRCGWTPERVVEFLTKKDER
ncbi:MAG TPA: hypothetical protein VJL80_06355 [Aeromicrobium sp.]|nr:hypothetical protein [Aeromicrobium sp.]HKY57641.1 hypothetical protein [Aeromicrobium sp.]